MLESTVWAQRDNISNLIVLDFWIKALFSSYGVICSPRILLWRVPDFPEDQSTRSGSPCILTHGSIQQILLLTAKLRSKHAILPNWILAYRNFGTRPDWSCAQFTARSSLASSPAPIFRYAHATRRTDGRTTMLELRLPLMLICLQLSYYMVSAGVWNL